MHTYISILRGINVSGKNQLKMEALRSMMEKLGFTNVKTYIQSGNVLFKSAINDVPSLELMISEEIERQFGLKVPVLVLTKEKLKTIIDQNPLLQEESRNPEFLHVSFLANAPINGNKEQILSKKMEGEEIVITDNAAYLFCPHGYGTTKLNNTFLESKLKVVATTRNWKTTQELLKMAQEI